VFDGLAGVVGDFAHLVKQVFSQTLARESVPAPKFLVAVEPAEYGGSVRHPSIGTNDAEAFAAGEPVADRHGNIGAIIGRSTALGLVHCESLSPSLVAKSRSSSTRSALELPLHVTF